MSVGIERPPITAPRPWGNGDTRLPDELSEEDLDKALALVRRLFPGKEFTLEVETDPEILDYRRVSVVVELPGSTTDDRVDGFHRWARAAFAELDPRTLPYIILELI